MPSEDVDAVNARLLQHRGDPFVCACVCRIEREEPFDDSIGRRRQERCERATRVEGFFDLCFCGGGDSLSPVLHEHGLVLLQDVAAAQVVYREQAAEAGGLAEKRRRQGGGERASGG